VTAPLAWLDGRIVTIDGPQLSLVDRGFLLGDGVFETLRARRGVAIEWDEHVARLHLSATALAIEIPFADGALHQAIGEVLAALELDGPGTSGDGETRGLGDAAIRITVSRGSSPSRGLLPREWRSIVPTVAITAWPYEPPTAALLGRGIHAIVSSIRRDPSSPLAGVKSTSRVDHVFARLEAERAAVDEAIFITLDDRLSETTTANLWLVDGDRVSTPGSNAAILAGTTRGWLLSQAPSLGVGVTSAREVDLSMADLLSADEAFLSSSVAGIVALTAAEGRPIGSGMPGPMTTALRAERERWIDERSRAL
jgi:branched-chain amino acid aminotransferase